MAVSENLASSPAEMQVSWADYPLPGRWAKGDRSFDQRTLDYLAERSVAAHVAETREAVKIHNDLAEAAPVAGLFHSTC